LDHCNNIHFVDGRVADGIYELNDVIGSFKDYMVNSLVGKLAKEMNCYMPKDLEIVSRKIKEICKTIIS